MKSPCQKQAPNWNSLVAYLPKKNFNFWHSINLPYPFVDPIRIMKGLWIMCHPYGRLCRKIFRAPQTPTKRIFHIMTWDSNSLDIFIIRWLFRICLSFSIFQLQFGRMKSLTVASGEGTLFQEIFNVSTRLKFPTQLSN